MQVFRYRRSVVTVAAIVAVAGVATTYAILQDDNPGPDPGVSRDEATKASAACLEEAVDASRYESGANAYVKAYEGCLEEKVGMTAAEVEDLVSPVSELPACDDLWTVDATWPSEDDTYGWQCRYGTGAGKRYKAEAISCFTDGEVDGWLVVGPDDYYIFRGGSVGYDAAVSDGSRIASRDGLSTELDLVRALCAGS